MSNDDGGASGRFLNRAKGVLDKLFGSCSKDPKGSVFRVWLISVVCILVYVCLAMGECTLENESHCLSDFETLTIRTHRNQYQIYTRPTELRSLW